MRSITKLDLQYARRVYGFRGEAQYLHGHSGVLTIGVEDSVNMVFPCNRIQKTAWDVQPKSGSAGGMGKYSTRRRCCDTEELLIYLTENSKTEHETKRSTHSRKGMYRPLLFTDSNIDLVSDRCLETMFL